jgi:hypothetical protein
MTQHAAGDAGTANEIRARYGVNADTCIAGVHATHRKAVAWIRTIRTVSTVLAFAAAAAIPSLARATVVGFAYASTDGSAISAFGTLDATLLSADKYRVDAISGARNSAAMSLLAAGSFDGNDNIVYTSGAPVSYGGLSFSAAGTSYNVGYDATGACFGIVGTAETSATVCASPSAVSHAVRLIVALPTLFDFTYVSTDGSGISASGTFVTVQVSPTGYQVVAIDGSRNLDAMALLGVNAFDSNDNLIYDTGPVVDYGGLSFASGGSRYNVGYDVGGACFGIVGTAETSATACSIPDANTHPISFTLSRHSVPEPSPLALVCTALVLAGLAGCRRPTIG